MRRVALVSCAALIAACGQQNGATSPTAARQTKPAGTVEVADIARIDAVLAEHRGHGVLLNFWAIWCAPCVEELPELMEVGREHAQAEGDVVLVSYDLMIPGVQRDEVVKRVEAFAKKRGMDVPILIYDAPDFEAINEHFKLPGGVPVTLAYDRTGKLVDTQDGGAKKPRFEEMMRKALAR
jgi:thiol-disulfide isomerase/thioredoxin